MSRQSRIDALRRLAERPGTEHEGEVARAMLRKPEQSQSASPVAEEEREPFDLYAAYMRREISLHAFVEALRGLQWTCPCGGRSAHGSECANWQKHLAIQTKIRGRFKKGDRVLYNYHAYPPDCPGRVAAYVPLKPENGTYPWAWLSVKFDHLKSARQVPIFSAEGWHLKHAKNGMEEI